MEGADVAHAVFGTGGSWAMRGLQIVQDSKSIKHPPCSQKGLGKGAGRHLKAEEIAAFSELTTEGGLSPEQQVAVRELA